MAHRILGSLLLAGMALILVGAATAQQFDHTHALYDAIVKTRVVDDMVDYAALKADSRALDHYLAGLTAVSEREFGAWNEPQRLAFLFNLYNAATLHLILDHYPVKSIKDIGNWRKGPWDQPAVRLFGNTITLNDLEHDILRKHYEEPRLHLALVCAAKGCPPLRGEAYTAVRLDDQLDDQVRVYLSGPAGMRIDRAEGKVFLSSIFKWYGDDFVKKYTPRAGFAGLNKTKRAVLSFCARYTSVRNRRYLEAASYSIRFLDYDWTLNASTKKR